MRLRNNIIMALVILGISAAVFGQSAHQVSQGITGNNLAPGSPSGSYAVSDFESINPFSGKPSFSLPLLKVGGRGSAGYSMNLSIQKNWIIQHEVYDPNTYRPSSEQYFVEHKYTPAEQFDQLLSSGIDVSSQMGVMKGTRFGTNRDIRLCGSNQPCYDETLTKLFFITSDGTEIEFRDVLTGGKAKLQTIGNPINYSRGTNWVSVDGSNAVFVSNTDILDQPIKSLSADLFLPSGTLTLANGTKYTIQDGKATEIKDINGNRVTLGKDSLGRETTVTQSLNPAPNILRDKVINFKGTNGTPRTIKIRYSSLGTRLSAGFTLTDLWNLFPTVPRPSGTPSVQLHNPEVVSFVELPDGRNYELKYNNYGELTEIMLPTGGKIEYVWQTPAGIYGEDANNQPASNTPPDDDLGFRVYRRIEKRRVYENNQLQNETVYSMPETVANNSSVTVETYKKENGILVLDKISKHYYSGNPLSNVINPDARKPTEEPNWLEGKELKTEIYNASNVLLRQADNLWQPGTPLSANPTANINARLAEVKTTLADSNLVSKTNYSYDEFNNQTDVYEYDYGVGQAGAFKRRSHTDFVTDTNYLNANLKSLSWQSWVSSDANGDNKVSLSQIEYDNYSVNPIISRSNVVGHDTANYGTNKTIRGNVTKVTSYSNVNDINTAISVKSQYDILGNVVKIIDAKGNQSTISYNDNFGSPDNNAQMTTQPTQLNGQSTFAFATSGTNAIGWIIGYTQFDYFTGQQVNSEDINGVISKTIYNDLLDRPTQSVTAIGTAYERQSNITYHDELTQRSIEVKSDLFALNDNLSKSESFYDGLARIFESRKYESDGGYIASKTVFDAFGRAKRATNPYRPLRNEPIYWTENFFDSLGRIIKVKTPDGAEVTTDYSGNVTTVTDQALKKRRSVTNALGQLTRVDEPNDAGQLDVNGVPAQSTNYVYDTLNNLITVNQGVQTRSFVYDSLSRLKQANNPENGVVNFAYDNNSNLTSKTDARQITTNFVYDNLNRITNRNYTPPNPLPVNYQSTPNVTYTYDDPSIQFSKGKLTKVSSIVSETKYNSFDILGRVLSHSQITDGNTYNSSNVYDLSGFLIEETYPSGRVVKNTLDQDGDLQQVQSRKSNGTFQNYANSFTYSSAGAVSSMRLGNGKFENTTFNSRLQPIQIGLGSSAASPNLLKLNFDYGETDNNGNVKSQQITIQQGNQTPLVLNQTYMYDSLNRLKSAEEKDANNATVWKQTYTFDRYGNRNFDTVNNNTTNLIGTQPKVTNPEILPTNNRLKTDQDGDNVVDYLYDASGNMTTDAENKRFSYDAENKQVQYFASNNQTTNPNGKYFFDGMGKRVKKEVGSEITIFVYDASEKLIGEYSTQQSDSPKINYTTNDHLDSSRITSDESGKVISRTDYMPYGEEVFSTQRTANLGYTVQDSVKQGFTGYIKDDETELDYAQARMYKNRLGRFTSIDLGAFTPADSQSWNRYLYVQNNPLKYKDSSGNNIELTGDQSQSFIDYLEKNSGLKLKYKTKNGVTTITGSSKNKNFTGKVNKEFANIVKLVAGSSETAKFNVTSTALNSNNEVIFFDDQETASQSVSTDSAGKRTVPAGNVNMISINSVAKEDSDFAQAAVGHFLIEGLEITKLGTNYVGDEKNPGAHNRGLEVESKILSEATGVKQERRYQPPPMNGNFHVGDTISFVYTTIQYDVTVKSDGGATVAKVTPPTIKRPKN